VPDIIFLATRGIADNVFLCDGMMTEAEVTGTYKRLEHVHGDLGDMESDVTGRVQTLESNVVTEIDENETLIIGVSTHLAAHDANMENRTDEISDEIQYLTGYVIDLREENLRIMIEIGLADSDNKTIGVFAFPEVLGGRLKRVHEIVEDSITRLLDAGEDVGNAESFLIHGEAYMADGDWERAYDKFGRAYRTATGG
jgi:hypothetical protein